MAFRIYSAIPNRVVSVQVDMDGQFDVIGGANNPNTVNLGFARVHVAGGGIQQAARVMGIDDGDLFQMSLQGNQVQVDLV